MKFTTTTLIRKCLTFYRKEKKNKPNHSKQPTHHQIKVCHIHVYGKSSTLTLSAPPSRYSSKYSTLNYHQLGAIKLLEKGGGGGRGLVPLVFASDIPQAPAVPGKLQRPPWAGGAPGAGPREPAGSGAERTPTPSPGRISPAGNVCAPAPTGLNGEGGGAAVRPPAKINSSLLRRGSLTKARLVLLCQLLGSRKLLPRVISLLMCFSSAT